MKAQSSLLALLLSLAVWSPPAAAAPIFNSPTGSSIGCSGGAFSPAVGASTFQASGGGSCPVGAVFPHPQNPGQYIAQFPGINGNITGTGSGVFDTALFPLTFTTSRNLGLPAMNVSFEVNGNTVYSGSGSGTFDAAAALAGQTLSTWRIRFQGAGQAIIGPGIPPPNLTDTFSFCVGMGTNQLCTGAAPNTQGTPVLPSSPVLTPPPGGGPPAWVFSNVPGGRWFDPPLVDTFRYEGTGGTTFQSIQLPTGIGSTITIWTGPGYGTQLGTFASGATVNLNGIAAFEIRGITPLVDAALSNAFPLFIDFTGGGNGSFTQTPIENTAVPEPGSLWLLGSAAALSAAYRRRGGR